MRSPAASLGNGGRSRLLCVQHHSGNGCLSLHVDVSPMEHAEVHRVPSAAARLPATSKTRCFQEAVVDNRVFWRRMQELLVLSAQCSMLQGLLLGWPPGGPHPVCPRQEAPGERQRVDRGRATAGSATPQSNASVGQSVAIPTSLSSLLSGSSFQFQKNEPCEALLGTPVHLLQKALPVSRVQVA